jgi:hypothetical protein
MGSGGGALSPEVKRPGREALTTYLQLLPRLRIHGLYAHQPLRLHGVVLKLLSTETTLALCEHAQWREILEELFGYRNNLSCSFSSPLLSPLLFTCFSYLSLRSRIHILAPCMCADCHFFISVRYPLHKTIFNGNY